MKSRTEELLDLIEEDKENIESSIKITPLIQEHLKSILDSFRTIVVDRDLSYNVIVDTHSIIGAYLDSIEFYDPKYKTENIKSLIFKYSDFVKYETQFTYSNIEKFIEYKEEDACGLF